MDHKKLSLIADFSLLFVAIVWGASFVAAKEALAFTGVLNLVFLRFLIASLVLLPMAAGEIGRLSRGDMLRGAGLGLVLCAIFIAETYGVFHTSATNAAFLISLCILFTPILDAALSGRMAPPAILGAAALSCLGTGLLVWKDGLHFNSGDLLILLAAALRAVMVTATNRTMAGRAMSSVALTTLQLGVVTLVSGGLVLAQGGFNLPMGEGTQRFWVALIFLAGLCTLAAFFIQNLAVRLTNPTRVGFLMGAEPLFGALFAALLLSERMGMLAAAGAGLIVAGTYLGLSHAARVRG